MDAGGGDARRRRRGTAVSLALATLVALPMLRPVSDDGFPFSTYPMFARDLPATVALPHVVVLTTEGERRPLPPEAIGTDEVIGAFEMVRAAIAGGETMLEDLCGRAALHPSAVGEAVVVATDTYDVVGYFDGHREPVSSHEHIRCVPGGRNEVAGP